MNNALLWIAIVFFIFIALRSRFTMSRNDHVKNLSSEEAYKLINANKNLVILDVRTKVEFEAGHILKAKNIPVQQLSARIKELDKYKNTPILVHCASGGRSPSAIKTLVNNNFTEIYHMNKGLSTWKYPLKR